MERIVNKGNRKTMGLQPGALVHVGEKKMEGIRITLIAYDPSGLSERRIHTIKEGMGSHKKTETTSWINIDGLHDVEVVKSAGECFKLHPLIMEDILNTNQRPKMEDQEGSIFIVLKMYGFDEQSQRPTSEQISLILGSGFLLSFQEKEGDLLDGVRNRLRSGKTKIRSLGADYLLYAILDAIVDGYLLTLERIGDKIENMEEDVLKHPTPETVKNIQESKEDLILLRKSIRPFREALSHLDRSENELLQDYTKTYLKDLADHVNQVMDTIETYRDILAGHLDIYLSNESHKMNNIMKTLTLIATIFMPLTFIAGIYGMNFDFMPELKYRLGYPLAILFMIGIGIAMGIFFKRKKWF